MVHIYVAVRNKNDYKCNKQSKRTKEGCLCRRQRRRRRRRRWRRGQQWRVYVFKCKAHNNQTTKSVSTVAEIVFYWCFCWYLRKWNPVENSPFSQYTIRMRILLSGKRKQQMHDGNHTERQKKTTKLREREREKWSVRKRHILTKDRTNPIHKRCKSYIILRGIHVPGV